MDTHGGIQVTITQGIIAGTDPIIMIPTGAGVIHIIQVIIMDITGDTRMVTGTDIMTPIMVDITVRIILMYIIIIHMMEQTTNMDTEAGQLLMAAPDQ